MKVFFYPQVKDKTASTGLGNLKLSQQSKKKLSADKPTQLKEAEGDAWNLGDWGSFEESPLTSSTPAAESQSKNTPDDGWGQDDWDAEDWGQDKLSKAELAKKKREERRQKLQAQKDKRAAGARGPMKLGAVKMQ